MRESWPVGKGGAVLRLFCFAPEIDVLSAVSSVIPWPSQSLSIPRPFVAFRRIEELTQELAASNQLVEMLSAEKRDLQQCLEGSPVMEGQVSRQGWGDPREEHIHPGLG